jgi:23S rRNA (adenine2503-C2)-methyltransferase
MSSTQPVTTTQFDLMNFDHQGLKELFTSIDEKPFRATQLLKWLHQAQVTDFDQMTNLSKTLRTKLAEVSYCTQLTPIMDSEAPDGTRKWLFKLAEGNAVETVYIPEKSRGTLCISSQVGCGLNCSFCATATQGFNRDLKTSEIIGQVWHAVKALRDNPSKSHLHQKVTNIVFMGMGEPLLNFDNVLRAINLLLDDNAYGLSKYRVTLSTSGLVPQMRELATKTDCALAVSLHAPNDPLRDQLVPINKKYPLAELLEVCRNYYPATSKRRITIEYVMLKGVNDTPAIARELAKVLKGVPCKINLIPFNPFPMARYERSTDEAIDLFIDILAKAGYTTIVRRTRGNEIDAACGQLKGNFQDRTSRSQRYKKEFLMRSEAS